jgi:transposase
MAKRATNSDKKAVAKTLYITGTLQKVIAERLSVSPVTVNRWVKDGGWEAIRSARNVTRPEIVNKLLASISKMLDKVLEEGEGDNADAFDGLGDKLSKLATTIERLDKKANIVDAVEVFEDFHMWLANRQHIDKSITDEFLKAVNKFQDQYIQDKTTR